MALFPSDQKDRSSRPEVTYQEGQHTPLVVTHLQHIQWTTHKGKKPVNLRPPQYLYYNGFPAIGKFDYVVALVALTIPFFNSLFYFCDKMFLSGFTLKKAKFQIAILFRPYETVFGAPKNSFVDRKR